jgi:polysaccharide biosynthesis/export protein
MPLRSRVTSVAGIAAFLSLCSGVGCQTSSLRAPQTEMASQPVRDYIRGLTMTPAAPLTTQGTVIASSLPMASLARPTAPAPLPGNIASSWEPIQRVSAEQITPTAPANNVTRVSAPTLIGGAARAAIDIPAVRPVAVAASPPNDPPPAELTPPRLEPQPVVAAPVVGVPNPAVVHQTAPREFAKQPLPPYVVEPPDILLVTAGATATLENRPVEGQHLVRPDGTIGLGVYGSVYVAGLTLEEVRDAVAAQLQLSSPKIKIEDIKKVVVVDVLAYNSKVYYVITDGGGYGEQVYSFPITGNETVLDAVAKINGLPAVASKKRVWIARATPGCTHPDILPVDWCGVAQRGYAATNYQIFPDDRVYVGSDKRIQVDSWLAKFLNPVDRVLGTVLLGSSTVNSIKSGGNFNGAGTGR